MTLEYYGHRRGKKRGLDRLPLIPLVIVVFLCYATVIVVAVGALVGVAQVTQ